MELWVDGQGGGGELVIGWTIIIATVVQWQYWCCTLQLLCC